MVREKSLTFRNGQGKSNKIYRKMFVATLSCVRKGFLPFLQFVCIFAVTACISCYIFYFHSFSCRVMIVNLTSNFDLLIEMDESPSFSLWFRKIS